jgi:hypothetical protein
MMGEPQLKHLQQLGGKVEQQFLGFQHNCDRGELTFADLQQLDDKAEPQLIGFQHLCDKQNHSSWVSISLVKWKSY